MHPRCGEERHDVLPTSAGAKRIFPRRVDLGAESVTELGGTLRRTRAMGVDVNKESPPARNEAAAGVTADAGRPGEAEAEDTWVFPVEVEHERSLRSGSAPRKPKTMS